MCNFDMIKRGGDPSLCPCIWTPGPAQNNIPMDYFTYIYLQYSGVLSMLHSDLLLLVMHAFFIPLPCPLGHAH